MDNLAIRADGLSKRYRIGTSRVRHDTLRDQLVYGWRSLVRGKRRADDERTLWALRDLSFEVKHGDILGILGRNGAGKSTLLKILSRTTEPTSGSARIWGRVGSLLEVGTGFHPELTGRDNTYLNGAILGMRKAEIDRKFDEIVAFAEVERFIDTPVKRYSSGMYVRLAFAVAAHLEPDVLIIDEVLAVGDVAFQRKCLGKMQEVARSGRTVIFVSHNIAALQQLTKITMLLDSGRLLRLGPTPEVVEQYLREFAGLRVPVYDATALHRPSPDLRRQVEFLSLAFDGDSPALLPANAPVRLRVTVRAQDAVPACRLSFTLFHFDGVPVGSAFSEERLALAQGEVATLLLEIDNPGLAPGAYYFGLATGRGNHLTGHLDFDIVTDVLHFEVMPPEGLDGTVGRWSPGWGPLRLSPPKLERIE